MTVAKAEAARKSAAPYTLRLASILVAKLDRRSILNSMPKLPEVIFLALIFLAVGVALMMFLGPILRMLGWPS